MLDRRIKRFRVGRWVAAIAILAIAAVAIGARFTRPAGVQPTLAAPVDSCAEQADATRIADRTPLYYVAGTGDDANRGSRDHPWATLQHAADKASPGATVIVLPGIYTQPVKSTISGTANARIRFISEIPEQAKILTRQAYSTWSNHGEYVDIVGFDVSGDGCLGIVNWASHVRIIGNRVHDISAPASLCGSNGGAGIDDAGYDATDDDIIGNVVFDIGDRDHPNEDVHGIYHANHGGHVQNNLVYRSAAWGIAMYHASDNVAVVNNTVVNNGGGGILVANNASGIDDTLVAHNIAAYNDGFGISERDHVGSHNLYINNLSFGNTKGAISLLHRGEQQNTIEAQPAFIHYTGDGTGDYNLHPPSSLISRYGTGLGVQACSRPSPGR